MWHLEEVFLYSSENMRIPLELESECIWLANVENPTLLWTNVTAFKIPDKKAFASAEGFLAYVRSSAWCHQILTVTYLMQTSESRLVSEPITLVHSTLPVSADNI